MSAARATLGLIAVLLAACGGEGGGAGAGGSRPASEPKAAACTTRLPERAAPSSSPSPAAAAAAAAAAPPFAAPLSTIVVNAELPLGGLRQALEAKVPRRVAEEHDHDIGVAGRLEYTVDRGPFALRVDGDALVVESVLRGRAQACAKGRCYAGCEPAARVTGRVPLRLGADYKLHASEVRIEVTRGCQVRALGGIISVDVTPVLRGALAQQSRRVQAAIDRELPDLRPEVARLWAELSRARELPLGMCVLLEPEEIVQGPASGAGELARLRFGLRGRPELRVKCGAAPAATAAGAAGAAGAPGSAKPLPPLRDDAALPALGDVHLAIALGEDAAARAVERAGEVVDFGGRRGRVGKATGDVSSGLLVDLNGEVCGDLALSVAGVAWNEQQALHLTGAAPLPGERERFASASLEAAPVARAVERAPVALPIALGALPTMLPELARSMSDADVTVSASVESARPGGAGLRGAEVIAVAVLRGAVTLRAKAGGASR